MPESNGIEGNEVDQRGLSGRKVLIVTTFQDMNISPKPANGAWAFIKRQQSRGDSDGISSSSGKVVMDTVISARH